MRVAEVRLSHTGYRWLRFDEPVRMDAIGKIVTRKQRRRPHRVNWDAIEAMTEARRKLPLADLDSVVQEYIKYDVTLQELAGRYGMTHQGISWAIRNHDPRAADKRKERRRREQEAQEQAELMRQFNARCREALAEDRKCKACGAWILRASTSTCSPECAEAYPVLRIFDDPNYHRRAMAKVYLRSPENYSESNLEWARRMLGPNPPKRNRTYLIPGSERAEIIKKYRPERYRELVSA